MGEEEPENESNKVEKTDKPLKREDILKVEELFHVILRVIIFALISEQIKIVLQLYFRTMS